MGIETIIREVRHIEEYVSAYTCNVCGCRHEASVNSENAHVIRLSGGFGNTFPGDDNELEIVICSDCLETWCKSLKVPPTLKMGSLWPQEYYAVHSETGKRMAILSQWMWDPEEGTPALAELEAPVPSHITTFPDDGEVWEHFKGSRYLMQDCAFDLQTKEPHVIYRALYGDSKVWVRPLRMWFEEVERGIPRFKQVP